MKDKKQLTKKLNHLGATALLLVSSLLPGLGSITQPALAQTKQSVAQDISTVTQTGDYGTLTGDGSTAKENWLGFASQMSFGTGNNAYLAGNMPYISGSSIGLQAVTPTFDSTGTAVLTSTDNPAGTTVNAPINTLQKAAPSGQGSVILNASVDWKSNFTMSYDVSGAGAYGSQSAGTGLFFTPLSPTKLRDFLNGNSVAFAPGGSAKPIITPPSSLANLPINQIPNSFGLFARGEGTGTMAMLYTPNTGSPTAYSAPSVTMYDPTNPGSTFTWTKGGTSSSLPSGYQQTNITSSATAASDFTKATYTINYTASSGLLTITSSATNVGGTGFTGYGNLANIAQGTKPVFQTYIPDKLKGQAYSFAIGRNMYNTKGIGVGTSGSASFPTYSGQALTTSVKINNYSIPAATSSVSVNYVDEDGNAISSAPATSIKANIGSTLGVNQLSPNFSEDDWSYDAKTISGYTAISANDVSVVADASQNVLNIVYHKSAEPATTTFTFAYDSVWPNAPALPADIVENGNVGDAITTTADDIYAQVPAGYGITTVDTPVGTSETAIEDALSSYPTMASTTNPFTITIAPMRQLANFTFQYDDTKPSNAPALPEAISETGYTGHDIEDPSEQVNSSIPDHYFLTVKDDQTGKTYDSVTAALADHPIYAADDDPQTGDNFTLILTYEGEISLQTPDTIDFGLNKVSNQTQNLAGKLDQALAVTDSRTSGYGGDWTVSVAQTAPIQEVDSAGQPVAGGLSFDGALALNGNTLSSDSLVVFSQENGGSYNISDSWTAATQGFHLQADVAHQKAGVQFQGSLTWSLISAP